jgi:hypothetical protein
VTISRWSVISWYPNDAGSRRAAVGPIPVRFAY